ncbi:MAG: glycosyltransferase [Burkholderiales bacterium]
MYAALAGGQALNERFHLAFSFNFTHLPHGLRRRVMAKAFQRVHRFTVSSTLERELYARVFDIDPARIDMLHWSVQPYDGATLAPVVPEKGYICAVGSQARDYAVLLDAMRLMPQHRLHLVATPENLAGLSIPGNVTVHTGVSFDFCAALVKHARVMALPLQGVEVPCGHVTAVMAMHLGTPIVATDSVGLHDYLRHGESGLLCTPREPQALRHELLQLLEDADLAARLARAAQHFAQVYCIEQRAIEYARGLIDHYVD